MLSILEDEVRVGGQLDEFVVKGHILEGKFKFGCIFRTDELIKF